MGEPQKDNSVATRSNPEIIPELLREKLKNPKFLPTREDIFHAFNPDGYLVENYETFLQREWLDYTHDIENPVYELFNREYINALGDYLSKQVEDLGATVGNPITILEVCAGNGRLTHFLKEKLEQTIPGKAKLIATDSGASKLAINFPVEKLDHKSAIEKYNPQIILCSWMPLGIDLSADFRKDLSVKEYLLIGQPTLCGNPWYTYGENVDSNSFSYTVSDEEIKEREKQLAPYKADGFEEQFMKNISKFQICRIDEPRVDRLFDSYSATYSYKRKI